ncbi:2Fe-2S iron-sulfur cluster-binding family protein [Dyadobacter aurulentus]|uniref:hypothetical protein n=1 Tax=Dyadobacter sp. UC 10 TaxID=2605428 RepID=UPI0011F350A6|nr:hypothetical protein [Dyadobacter sp. UC 10]KAA0991974.1 hypothetical protein FXO21_18230 [Dyadobacter sp. UC 10]
MEPGLINFTVIYREQSHEVQVPKGRYFSLMSLLSDYLHLSGFGICSGMGSCGTCEVYIRGRIVPACTIPVDDALAGSIINIDAANAR